MYARIELLGFYLQFGEKKDEAAEETTPEPGSAPVAPAEVYADPEAAKIGFKIAGLDEGMKHRGKA